MLSDTPSYSLSYMPSKSLTQSVMPACISSHSPIIKLSISLLLLLIQSLSRAPSNSNNLTQYCFTMNVFKTTVNKWLQNSTAATEAYGYIQDWYTD